MSPHYSQICISDEWVIRTTRNIPILLLQTNYTSRRLIRRPTIDYFLCCLTRWMIIEASEKNPRIYSACWGSPPCWVSCEVEVKLTSNSQLVNIQANEKKTKTLFGVLRFASLLSELWRWSKKFTVRAKYRVVIDPIEYITLTSAKHKRITIFYDGSRLLLNFPINT